MINLLMVDDNRARIEQVKSAILIANLTDHVKFVSCESADEARLELLEKYDLLILDVVLPKKIDSTPQASISVALLSDICDSNKRYIRPSLTIGLTSNIDDLEHYKSEFSRNVTVVLDGSIYSEDWKAYIIESIKSLVGNQLKIIQQEKDKLLITVHGIRTYGQWQSALKSAVNTYSRDFEYAEVKYGFFDLPSFSIPSLRDKKADVYAKRILSILKDNPEKDVYIVAHSFGTYILSRALKMHKEKGTIRTIILCGSPLTHDHDIDHIVDSSTTTINECGTRDGILVLARCLLIGLGDAGRIGFSREHTSKFTNRFHKGGHSLYFKSKPNPTFYQKFWISHLTTNTPPIDQDQRSTSWVDGVLDITIKAIEKVKIPLYFAAFYFLSTSVHSIFA